MLTIAQHPSAKYAPRTFHNAKSADLTVAFAVDFNTRGEQLTKEAAGGGDRYLALSLPGDALKDARVLFAALRRVNAKVLNVAGNGIYTLRPRGVSQEECNRHVYEILKKVHAHWPIERIVSGGQTGIDLAGGVAGFALGIDVVMTLPSGYLQRHEDGVDMKFSEDEIRNQVEQGVEVVLGLR
ncbi:hypothetical protein [Ralstonia pseudosolanacearum]|uniref:hypothetical protein n=1 Tax=Ralstonia pseudosolanacearum TaxID=1310165 RepID=UPI003CF79A2E